MVKCISITIQNKFVTSLLLHSIIPFHSDFSRTWTENYLIGEKKAATKCSMKIKTPEVLNSEFISRVVEKLSSIFLNSSFPSTELHIQRIASICLATTSRRPNLKTPLVVRISRDGIIESFREYSHKYFMDLRCSLHYTYRRVCYLI